MSKKSIRDFSELRSLLKKTETEAEAKAVLKGESAGSHKMPQPPKRPTAPIKQRNMSAIDQFIVDTLALPLQQLSVNQLHDARITIQEASECANNTVRSIQRQIETLAEHHDAGWKQRALSAMRFKVLEEHELQERLKLADDLIARAKPPALKLVEPPKPRTPVAAYEIRNDVPRLNAHQSDEWRKYPFDKLGMNQSFRFGAETTDQVRRLISAAARHLGRHFSYRTEPDGVIAVWRVEGPGRKRPC